MTGALRNEGLSPEAWGECICDGVFAKGSSFCHRPPVMSWGVLDKIDGGSALPGTAFGYCPSWGGSNRLHFFDSYHYGGSAEYPHEELERVMATASPADAEAAGPMITLYASNGIGYAPIPDNPVQDALETDMAWRGQWRHTLEAARNHAATRVILGTVGCHEGRLASQKPQPIAAYNAWVKQMARNHSRELGVELLDVAAFTRGLLSVDGIHFHSHDNVALAQVLLNLLAEAPPSVVLAARPGARDRRRPGALWRDGPHTLSLDQADVDPATRWFIGEEFELRGCRCFPDWQARSAANSSASVCHCRGWCPPRVTPHFLTHETAGCQDKHDLRLDRPQGGYCLYDCRRHHPAEGVWEAHGVCTLKERPRCAHPEADDTCTNCKRGADGRRPP